MAFSWDVSTMIVLIGASLIGAAATAVVLWPYGVLLALLCSPFGGSLAAALAAGMLYLLRRSRRSRRAVSRSSLPKASPRSA